GDEDDEAVGRGAAGDGADDVVGGGECPAVEGGVEVGLIASGEAAGGGCVEDGDGQSGRVEVEFRFAGGGEVCGGGAQVGAAARLVEDEQEPGDIGLGRAAAQKADPDVEAVGFGGHVADDGDAAGIGGDGAAG